MTPRMIIPDGTNRLSQAAPVKHGWVVETIIEGRMAWMIKPVPLTSHTFDYDLAKAHIFEREGYARDCKASVWCWHDRHGQHAHLEVVWCNDDYRAKVAQGLKSWVITSSESVLHAEATCALDADRTRGDAQRSSDQIKLRSTWCSTVRSVECNTLTKTIMRSFA